MPLPSKKTFFNDYVFKISENVYDPAEDSFLFAENLHIAKGEKVLDMGTGSGILGVLAAKHACEVIAVDLNPHAIKCAKQNAACNAVSDKMLFVQSDLFTALTDTMRFDVVLFNAPYVPSRDDEMTSWLDRAWAGGVSGRQVIDKFISQVPIYIEQTGYVLLMQSTLAGVDDTVSKFTSHGFKTEIAARLSLPFFETLVLLKATYPD